MKLIFILASVFLIPGAVIALVDPLLVIISWHPVLYPIAGGFLAAVVIYYLMLRRYYTLQVFEHEFTHAIVAVLFLRRVSGFVATERGGHITHSGRFGGRFGDMMITLAPYFLPTFPLALALIRPVVPDTWFPWYDVLIGATLGYHTTSTIDETITNYRATTSSSMGSSASSGTDIGKVGIVTSTFLITALTIVAHGVVLHLIVGGYRSAGQYFIGTVEKSAAVYLGIWTTAAEIFGGLIKQLN